MKYLRNHFDAKTGPLAFGNSLTRIHKVRPSHPERGAINDVQGAINDVVCSLGNRIAVQVT